MYCLLLLLSFAGCDAKKPRDGCVKGVAFEGGGGDPDRKRRVSLVYIYAMENQSRM